MPTYEVRRAAFADYRRLSREQRRAFRRALEQFVLALRASPPEFPRGLRIKGVEGHPGVFELTFAPDGRATFEYGSEKQRGEPHIVWRRIGSHDIFRAP